MTSAVLILEDGPKLLGMITSIGGDHARMQVATQMTAEEVGRYRQGLIEIDGGMQRVGLETVLALPDEDDVIEVSMRLCSPVS